MLISITPGSCRHPDRVPKLDVGDLVADDEFQDIILVLADQVEEPPTDVNESPRMGEGVHGIGIQDRECVLRIPAREGLEEGFGSRFHASLPGAGLLGRVEKQDALVQFASDLEFVLSREIREVPGLREFALIPEWVEFPCRFFRSGDLGGCRFRRGSRGWDRRGCRRRLGFDDDGDGRGGRRCFLGGS